MWRSIMIFMCAPSLFGILWPKTPRSTKPRWAPLSWLAVLGLRTTCLARFRLIWACALQMPWITPIYLILEGINFALTVPRCAPLMWKAMLRQYLHCGAVGITADFDCACSFSQQTLNATINKENSNKQQWKRTKTGKIKRKLYNFDGFLYF